MKVFVQINYGKVEVFAAEDTCHYMFIYERLVDSLKDNDDNDAILADAAEMAAYESKSGYEMAINYLLEITKLTENESFQRGSGFNYVQL